MPKKKTRKAWVPFFGDTHGGDEHGLIDPNTHWPAKRRDGSLYDYYPKLNDIQEYLSIIYANHNEKCVELAGRDPMYPMHGGDMASGNKYVSDDTMSPSVAKQKAIAYQIMHRWLDRPNVRTMRFVEGTDAHDWEASGMSYIVAEHLREKYPKKDIQVVQHGLATIEGVEIDYAHHGPTTGKRLWLKGNDARLYLKDFMLREILSGRKPADIVWRCHYHEPIIETVRMNGYTSTLIITPSYSFPGAWTVKVTQSIYEICNGMFMLEIENGRVLDIHEFIERTDIRTRETFGSAA